MDNVCHTLVGAALAKAGLERRTPRALATLMIAANLPDVDAVAAFTEQGLAIRRGITHGLPALVVLPLLLTVAVVAWDRWRGPGPRGPVRPGGVLLIAAIGVLTHPFLDWLNTYGLRWLMPLDGRWFYGDALFIVDPWVLLTLGVGIGLASWLHRPAPARAALALVAGYIGVQVLLTAIGRELVAAEVGARHPGPHQVMVEPVPGYSWRRIFLVADADRYLTGAVDWGEGRALLVGEPIARGRNLEAAARASTDPRARAFHRWTRFPFYRREGDRIVMDDARYSRGGPSFARVVIPAPGP